MPFDPTLPRPHSESESAVRRAQLTALDEQDTAPGQRIDNLPPGVTPAELVAAILGTARNPSGDRCSLGGSAALPRRRAGGIHGA